MHIKTQTQNQVSAANLSYSASPTATALKRKFFFLNFLGVVGGISYFIINIMMLGSLYGSDKDCGPSLHTFGTVLMIFNFGILVVICYVAKLLARRRQGGL